MLLEDLSRIESLYGLDLGHASKPKAEVTGSLRSQFDAVIRAESDVMGKHYEVFYCLEKSIRALVSDTIETAEKPNPWWASSRVPKNIQEDVASRIQCEIDTGMTRRSSDELDYTTFGELSVIITSNWDLFGGLFSSKKAVERVMANLNSLRGPIAHCSPLAEDEVLRLRLTVRDWFRLME